jgi:hypothetical protein
VLAQEVDRPLSPATFDVHEGDTIHEDLFVNMLSPWWSSSVTWLVE